MKLPIEKDDVLYVAIKDGETKRFRGRANTHDTTLEKLNEQGWGIYYCVCELKKGQRRRKVDFTGSWAVWVDKDNGKWDGPCSVEVRTSQDKYQYYWVLNELCEDGDRLERLLRGLADALDGDTAATDRTRVMRVPGFANHKNGWGVEMIRYNKEWKLEELEAEYCKEKEKVDIPEFEVLNALEGMLSGESVHDNRVKLSMYMANHGLAQDACLKTVDAVVDLAYKAGNLELERYRDRKANNKQVVATAYEKLNSETPEYEFTEAEDRSNKYTRFPRCGIEGIGVITEDILSNMFHPIPDLALPLAMHVVGTFGGGMHMHKGVTATRKRAICVRSGAGKDIVTQYVHGCIDRIDHAGANLFGGALSFSHRTVHKELREFRCRSYVMSEAGLSGQSEAGDIKNMRGYMLQLLSSKAYRRVSAVSTVSDMKGDDMVPISAPIVNIIAESTIDTYVKMMKLTGAENTGMMAREELIFPMPDHKYENINTCGFMGVGQKALDTVLPLAYNFLNSNKYKGVGDPSTFFSEIDDSACYEYLEAYLRDVICPAKDKHYESEALYNQYSRLYEKIRCTTLVLALADAGYRARGQQEIDIPVATLQHAEYAIAYQEAVLSTVLQHYQGGVFGDSISMCISVLEQAILRYPSLARDQKLSVNMPKRLVGRSWITKVLDITKVKALKQLADDTYRGDVTRARNTIVKEAMDRGLISKVEYKGKDVYKLARS